MLGKCTMLTCSPGFADCDGDPTNGCEIDLSLPTSCGACGTDCTQSEISVSRALCSAAGTCDYDACLANHLDLDGDRANGCEIATPLGIPEAGSLVLWLSGDDYLGTKWTDRSGSHRDFVCSACPTVGMKNGQQVVHFDGMTQFFTNSSDFNLFAHGMTALIVHDPGSSTTRYDRILEFNDDNPAGEARVDIMHGDAEPTLVYQSCDSGICPYAASTSWSSGWQSSAVELTVDGNVSMFKDGNQTTVAFGQGSSMSVPAPHDTPRTSNRIGFSNDNIGYYLGEMAEIIVYTAPISPASLTALQSYVQRRWGL